MTHDERIEKVARAIFDIDIEATAVWDECSAWLKNNYRLMATAALAAAEVDEMVREAAAMGLQFGGEYTARDSDLDAIVREVMGRSNE
jgi:hypothetical protein